MLKGKAFKPHESLGSQPDVGSTLFRQCNLPRDGYFSATLPLHSIAINMHHNSRIASTIADLESQNRWPRSPPKTNHMNHI